MQKNLEEPLPQKIAKMRFWGKGFFREPGMQVGQERYFSMDIQPKYMKQLRWPTNSVDHAYMRERASQNLARAVANPNENWFRAKLQSTNKKWTRQAQWGHRIFDFWCHEIGVAVEVDGPEHREAYDAYRDEYNLRRSGIVVLRVRNRNEDDAAAALAAIAQAESWGDRKERLRITGNTYRARRRLVSPQQEIPFAE